MSYERGQSLISKYVVEGRGNRFLRARDFERRSAPRKICPFCEPPRKICGRPNCPLTIQYRALATLTRNVDLKEVVGNSPPSVFVGRYGYPNVFAGPMVPPVCGDTSSYDLPETWLGKSQEEILRLRSSLVYGRFRTDVTRPQEGGSYDKLVELALSRNSPEAEMSLESRPRRAVKASEEVVLFGPAAPLRKLSLGTLRTDFRLEKRYEDTDLKASEALVELYWDKVPVSGIQRAFSIGLFGVKKNRRMVPTRWSITAVDSTLSLSLINELKVCPWINGHQVYENRTYDNTYIVLLIPSNWSFEWLEAWFPNSFWNRWRSEPVIYADHEHYDRRTTYAATGGCYYSTRLAVAEKLRDMRRQATAIVFREAHEGYLFPLGVWNVRENVRAAVRKDPLLFDALSSALTYCMSRLTIPLQKWLQASSLLHGLLYQRRIAEYL